MPITSQSAKNHNDSLPLQRRVGLLDFCLGRVRNYSEGKCPRTVPLRPLLLRHVHGWADRGGVGDVGAEALTSNLLALSFPHKRIKYPFRFESQVLVEFYSASIGLSYRE